MQRDKTKDRRDWRSDYISAGLEFSPLVPGSHSAQCHRRNALEDGLHDSGRRAREGGEPIFNINNSHLSWPRTVDKSVRTEMFRFVI